MPKKSKLHGAPPLDPRRGFAPGPHANLRPTCFALSDRKYFSRPPPQSHFEKRSAGPACNM